MCHQGDAAHETPEYGPSLTTTENVMIDRNFQNIEVRYIIPNP
jgi:hypothetical protein